MQNKFLYTMVLSVTCMISCSLLGMEKQDKQKQEQLFEFWYKSGEGQKQGDPVCVKAGMFDDQESEWQVIGLNERITSDASMQEIAYTFKQNPDDSDDGSDVKYYIVNDEPVDHPRWFLKKKKDQAIQPQVFVRLVENGNEKRFGPQTGDWGGFGKSARGLVPALKGSFNRTESGLSTSGLIKDGDLIELPFLFFEQKDNNIEARKDKLQETFALLQAYIGEPVEVTEPDNFEKKRNELLEKFAQTAIEHKYLSSEKFSQILQSVKDKKNEPHKLANSTAPVEQEE